MDRDSSSKYWRKGLDLGNDGDFRSQIVKANRLGIDSINKNVFIRLTGSDKRNKAAINDDFPAPVRPTMPTFSDGLIMQLMLFKTN